MKKTNPDLNLAPHTSLNLQGLRTIRQMIGGEHTINQMIVIVHVFYAFLLGEKCSQTSIIETEALPKTTVFNAITHWKALGKVAVVDDPDDARKHYVIPTQQALEQREQIWRSLLGLDIVPGGGS